MTAYRWQRNINVLRRAECLSRKNKLIGDLIARRGWPSIVAAQVASAKRGHTAAARFCERRAWPEDQVESPLSNISLNEAIRASENSGDVSEWLTEKSEMEGTDIGASLADGGEDNKNKPEEI